MGTALDVMVGAPVDLGGGAASLVTSALSATASKVGKVFEVDCDSATVTISHLGYFQASKTLTPTANSYQISLQGVDSAGLPDGTIKGAGNSAVATFTPGAGTNVWVWVALGTPVTVTRGDLLSVVLEHIVVDTTNFITAGVRSSTGGLFSNLPFALTHNGTSWTKAATHSWMTLLGWKNSDATIVGGFPVTTSTANSQAFGNTTEAAILFNLPVNFCSTYTVKGIEFLGTSAATGANTYGAQLYSTPTTVAGCTKQQTAAAIDVDNAIAASNQGVFRLMFPEATLYPCNAGTTYAVGLSTTGASGMSVQVLPVASVADFNAYPGGQSFWMGTRVVGAYPPASDTTKFTETLTTRLLVRLVLGDITAPASGGGMRLAGHGGLVA